MRAILIAALLLAIAAPAYAADGRSLYDAGCSRCHGSLGDGLRDKGPSLRGAGALGADFYLRTGYMPLQDSHDQPARARVLYDEQQLSALIGYVASLGHGPAIPTPHRQNANLSAGQELFASNCAGCHQIAARGGVVTGARVPPLDRSTPRQIAEAVRIGPYLMPRFPPGRLTAKQLDDLIAYVQYAKHPDDAGGAAIGNLGPWPEGMVTWLVAAAALVVLCCVFGRRVRA